MRKARRLIAATRFRNARSCVVADGWLRGAALDREPGALLHGVDLCGADSTELDAAATVIGSPRSVGNHSAETVRSFDGFQAAEAELDTAAETDPL